MSQIGKPTVLNAATLDGTLTGLAGGGNIGPKLGDENFCVHAALVTLAQPRLRKFGGRIGRKGTIGRPYIMRCRRAATNPTSSLKVGMM